MILRVPIAREVDMLVAGFEGGIIANLRNEGHDLLVSRHAKGATITKVILNVDDDQSCSIVVNHFVGEASSC